jgi:cell division septation protein DedD
VKRLVGASPLALAGIGGAVVLVGAATAAFAAWGIKSEEFSFTNTAATLSKGNRPDVSANGNTVTISWIPTRVVGATAVEGYRIKRYDDANLAQDPSGACETLVVQANCTDAMVPVGSWRYTVVPVQGTWAGPESSRSARVTVHPDRSVTVEPIPDPTATAASTTDPKPGPTPGATATNQPGENTVEPPAWTLDVGADQTLSAGDTLVFAGADPIPPDLFAKHWDGSARPVTLTAADGSPDTLTVTDQASPARIGPLGVGTAYVTADATFAGSLTAVDGRYVVTLDPPAAPSPVVTGTTEPPPALETPAAPETPAEPAPTETETATEIETTAETREDPPILEATRADAMVTVEPIDLVETSEP